MVREERCIEVMEVFDENGNKIIPENYNRVCAIKAYGIDIDDDEPEPKSRLRETVENIACKFMNAAADMIVKTGIAYLDRRLNGPSIPIPNRYPGINI